ncbi:ABC transporter ATP-binding protein [Propionigenium maris DSM 9537]|uniref:ABC transporter ATP-binding protein n=1 Tax=Propionigenium maris DSM 9537 TaxID=1123000 RepID=A0A9W6GJB3_9FUSO|nr:ABC transporter ATP-binding protein [Propionigenium maris]GLI56213.1 ABC transporter ATP-binding protein [Propionigenium maris DSM 9537]
MIRFEDVCLSFGGKTILDNFSLEIEAGEKILLNAPSGRGKSTLIKLLLGFIRPQRGSIYYKGKKLTGESIHSIRRDIAWVNQDITLRKLKVDELLKEVGDFSANRNINFFGRLDELLEEFALSREILHKNIDKLSGGERQRLGLIIAILMDREVLLLDEVTSSLDAAMKRKVEEWIASTHKTVILISHDSHWNTDNFRVVRW